MATITKSVDKMMWIALACGLALVAIGIAYEMWITMLVGPNHHIGFMVFESIACTLTGAVVWGIVQDMREARKQ